MRKVGGETVLPCPHTHPRGCVRTTWPRHHPLRPQGMQRRCLLCHVGKPRHDRQSQCLLHLRPQPTAKQLCCRSVRVCVGASTHCDCHGWKAFQQVAQGQGTALVDGLVHRECVDSPRLLRCGWKHADTGMTHGDLRVFHGLYEHRGTPLQRTGGACLPRRGRLGRQPCHERRACRGHRGAQAHRHVDTVAWLCLQVLKHPHPMELYGATDDGRLHLVLARDNIRQDGGPPCTLRRRSACGRRRAFRRAVKTRAPCCQWVPPCGVCPRHRRYRCEGQNVGD